MKTKNVYKIGLSLLIALALILPSATFMASSIASPEADDFRSPVTQERSINGIFSQQPFPIFDGGLFMENPDEEVIEIPDDEEITIPIEDWYIPWCLMLKEDQIPAIVKPHLEIYKITDGIEVIMYETSFEDNFDIYNNWVQIDQDCGIPDGYFDSWSWSDARASDGDHSMKSTMYDIYKGNQDDYLQWNGDPFNVCDQNAVVVYFDVWAEGQYDGDLNPFDYASFEIGDGTTWIENLTLDEENGHEYKFYDTFLPLVHAGLGINITANVEELGAGWWRVMYRANMSELLDLGLDCSNLTFRFDWHSDPQFQYEGAYIDNFKVISIEGEEEKIYQGHSQGPYEFIYMHEMFEFPLKWYPEEGCYRARLWLEVLDPEHNSTYDWEGHDYYFCVGDNIDCEITDMFIEDSFTEEIVEDGGIMIEGSDAHIVWTYHQGGNVPMENIEIKGTANKFQWETLFETDFEGNVNPLTYNYGSVHLTDRDAFTGSKSLGFFDEDTFGYATDEFTYAYGPEQDFQDVEEMYMDYYWKGITDPGDYLYPGIRDPHNGYVLGSSYGDNYGTRMGGYNPIWTGPTENGGEYVRCDLLDVYRYYRDLGYLEDSDGPIWETDFGFFFSTDDDGEITHPDAIADGIYWSGVFLDDVKVTSKKIGEEVWTETIIIPGPLEPCDIYEAQFEWEDVPFSNYVVCVEAMCEGDVDLDDNKICQELLILDNLEHMTAKSTETVDYTDECVDEWGICSSDYDNYLSTNPDSEEYAEDTVTIVELCPDGDSCINISGLTLGNLEFDVWWEIEEDYDYVFLEIHDGCPALFNEDWQEVKNWTGFSGDNGTADDDDWVHEDIDISSFITGDTFVLRFRLFSDPFTAERGFIIDDLVIGGVFGPDPMDNMNNWCVGCWSLGDFWDDFCIELPDLFIDNALIWETEIKDAYEAYLVIDHNYTFQNAIEFMLDFSNLAMDLWGTGDATNFTQITYPGHNLDWGLQVQFFYGPLAYGNNLFFPYYYPWDVTNASLATKFLDMSVVPAGLEVTVDMNQNVYNGYGGTAQIKATSYAGATESGSIILRTFGAANVKDETYTFDPADLPNPEKVTIEAYADWNYSAADLWQYYGCDITSATETAMGFLEISIDGGDTWQILDTFTGTSNGDVTDTYDITPWAGNDILIRFRVEGNDDSTDDRWWCINDAFIAGKTDESAPVSSATMSGTMKESGWYTTGVKVTITATDVGVGMGEIHYILDGSETVVSGDTAEFTVSGNGEHNIEFWAVDAMGNEETPHNTIPTFRIDMGSAPSVQITAPEPGLYLFGNKLLSASKVIIIGAFTVEATASDAESGIYRVQFFLDGDLISEDTELPFSAYVASKHMGAGTIKVVAEDFAQNTAEDTLDITYYKFL